MKPGQSNPSENGYTLMELLVVLAILVSMAAIATPLVLKYLESSRVSTAKTEVANISSALEMFKYDVGRYPTTTEGLSALVKAPTGVDNWNGPYLKKQSGILDPWGHAYNYKSPGEHGDFDLYSYGSSGAPTDAGMKPKVASW